jgi:hypothetical protein
MRLRSALLGLLLPVVTTAAVPATALPIPVRNQGVTINATPNPILAGEGVLIYGQLTGTDVANQPVILYHRVNPSRRYTLVGRTMTDSVGFYEFTRAEGLVYTNRSWFVRGPQDSHSRTVRERVAALVDLGTDHTVVDTSQAVVFSGHVTPNHAFERAVLQVQRNDNRWRTVASRRLDRDSSYQIVKRWRVPGQRVVRVKFGGDRRNVAGASDPLAVTVQQHEVPDFTLSSSDPTIDVGSSVTVSGKLYRRGTTTPEGNTPVTLCSRPLATAEFGCDTAGITGSDGSYSFTVSPAHNEVYVVQTTLPPHRHTARLLEAVRDDVTLTPSSSLTQAGQPVKFTGSATPHKAADTVYLQRLGADGEWHTVAVRTVRPDSSFQFTRVFGTAGTKQFRARVLPDRQNAGGVSSVASVSVTVPPVSSLPAAR